MALTSITIDGDTRVIRRLDEALKRVGSAQKPLSEIGDVLIREFKDNFPAEGRRLNEPWQELALSTRLQKARMGYGGEPILVRTGKLMRGFLKQSTDFYVRVYNNVPYFKYHQQGGPNLPKRRMILASERLKQEVMAVFTKFIHEAFK
jgi:phage gpG-like protein